ncbi:MAG: NEAT domain-containing protein [Eubacteriales bacterium]|nr:NEAT domain-containing protein [Eubacteriales bacterium]
MITTSDVISSDVKFYLDEVKEGETPENVDSVSISGYRRFAKGEEYCHVFDSSLKSNGQKLNVLGGKVTIEYDIPEDWNIETTTAAAFTADGFSLVVEMDSYIDRTERVFRYSTTDIDEVNATYVFLDMGSLADKEDLEALEPGIYSVELTLNHVSYDFRPSMANRSIIDNRGYLEVSEDGSGNKSFQLYYSMEPVLIQSVAGYMTGEFYCHGEDKTTATAVDVLEYYSDIDGNLQIDDWAKEWNYTYLKRLRFPLTEPMSNGTYMVKFTVPAMDSHLGDGTGIQYAALRVMNPQRIGTSAALNPLSGYHKSVLRAELDKADEYLQTLTQGTAEYSALQAEIAKAQSVYEADSSSEEIKAARDVLRAALPEEGTADLLQDGTYYIPFAIKDRSGQNTSAYQTYFDTGKALVVRNGDNLTISLPTVLSGDDYIISLKYADGVSAENPAAAFEAGTDGKTGTFTFTRGYTEDLIELSLQSYNNSPITATANLELDLSNAERAKATEEQLKAAMAKLEEAKLITEGDYTKSTYDALQAAIQDAQAKLSVDEPSYDIVAGQTKALTEAISNLISVKELRDKITEASTYIHNAPDKDSAGYEKLSTKETEARGVLVKADATKDEIAAMIKELDEAIEAFKAESERKPLADGTYEIPLDIYMSQSTNPSGMNRAFFNSAELKVADGNMTVTLNMQESDSKWVTSLAYAANWTSDITEGTAAEAYETDSDGNVTKYRFTVPYTEDLIHLWLGKTGATYITQAELYLDFANATLKAEPEPEEGLADGTYEIPLDIYMSQSTNPSGMNRAFFNSAELKVADGNMTVTLNMQESDSKWVTSLAYAANWTSDITEGTAAESYETDNTGNVTKYRFTVPYTEDLIHLWLGKTGAAYITQAELYLDFANAKLKPEEPESGLADGTYEIPLDIYMSQSTNPSGMNRAFFNSAELKVADGNMTVTLNMQESDSKWVTSLAYAANWTSDITEGTAAESYETDNTGNVTKYRFTVPYTEDLIHLWLGKTGAAYITQAELYLDFANATEKSENPETDRSALATYIAWADIYQESGFTTDSWNTFADALSVAKKVNEDTSASQTEIDTAVENLKNAMEALKGRGDLTALNKSIAKAEEALKKTDQYTSESLNHLKEVLEKVQDQIEAEADNMTQDDVDAQKELLDDAYAALVESNLPKLKAELSELVAQYQDYAEDDYTASSWTAFYEALQKAEKLQKEESTDEAAYTDAIAALKEAAEALVAVADTDIPKLRKELAELISKYEGYTEEDYTAESWTVFRNAFQSAKALSQNPATEEKSYTDVITALKTAAEALEEAEDTEDTTEALKQLAELKDAMTQRAESGGDGWEKTSYAAWLASIDAADTDNLYYLSNEQILSQIAWMNDEEAALVPANAAAASAAMYLIMDDYVDDDDVNYMEDTAEEKEEEETEAETEKETESTEAESDAEEDETESTEPETDVAEDETEDTEEEPETDADLEDDTASGSSAKRRTNAFSAQSTSDPFSSLVRFFGRSISLNSTSSEAIKKEETKTETKAAAVQTKTKKKAASSRLSIPDNGTYSVDFDLYQYEANSESMGNDAFVKPGLVIIKNGKATIYTELQAKRHQGLVGHLKDISLMINIKVEEDGLKYDLQKPDYIVYSDESDDYGAAGTYPKIVGLPVTLWQEYTPCQVDVPVMGNVGRIQAARLRIYWDTLNKTSDSTDIEDSTGGTTEDPDAPEKDALKRAIAQFEALDSGDYIEESFEAVQKSVTAGKTLMTLKGITQEYVDARTAAILQGIEALVPVASDDEMNELKAVITTAEGYSIDDYTAESYLTLSKAVIEGKRLLNSRNVTSGMISNSLKSINKAVNGLEKDDSGEIKTDELKYWISEAKKYIRSDEYTNAQKEELTDLVFEALELLGRSDVTQAEITEMTNKIKAAIDKLENSESEDSDIVEANQTLLAYINVAAAYETNKNSYTSASYQTFASTLLSARLVYSSSSATASEKLAAASALEIAMKGLTLASTDTNNDSGTDNSGSDEDDGYYKVSVRLWHSSMNKASMGDPALNRTAYVKIKDGDITMRLVTKKMTVSGITAHLHDFWIYNSGDYEEAELVSTENSKWIYEFELPNDSSTYYKCQVDPQVDVMGTDPVKARLKVSWSSLKEVDEDDWDDLEGDTDDDDDSSSSSSSGTTAVGTELKSTETGIIAKGNAGGPGVVLEAKRVTEGADFDKTAGAISNYANQFVLYDIKLRSGSNYVQPATSMTVRIPVPVGYDIGKLVLYRILDDGSAQQMSGSLNGSYFEVSLDHFSLYALAESNQVQAAVSNAAAAGGSTGTSVSAAGSAGGSSGTTVRTGSTGSTGSTRTGSSGTTVSASKTTGSAGSSAVTSGTSGTVRSVGSTAAPAAGSNASAPAVHTLEGRVIPYTGDRTPVGALMGVGGIAMLIFLGTTLSERKSQKRRPQEKRSA